MPVPAHADKTVTVAHDAVLPYVDLDMADFSRIVERMSADRQNCGSSAECDALAMEFTQAIDDWNSLANGGVVVGPSCAPSFPQDLILLADLPYIKSANDLLGHWVFEQKDTPDPATKLFTQKSKLEHRPMIMVISNYSFLLVCQQIH